MQQATSLWNRLSNLAGLGAGAAGVRWSGPDYQFYFELIVYASLAWGFWSICRESWSNRAAIVQRARMIEPVHIVGIGLVIAVGGVGWQLWRGDPEIAKLQSQVGSLKQQVKLAPAAAAPLKNEDPKSLKPRLTEYDVSHRQKIIDEILDYLDGKFMPVNVRSEKLKVGIWQAIATHAAIPELDSQADAIISVRDGYYPLLGRYTNFADIYSAAFDTSGWEPGMLAQSASLLRAELQELEQRGQTEQAQNILKNNTLMAKWQEDTSKLWHWINERKEHLFALRKKYEQAEVYPHEK
jgi:hypothetical protein